VDHPRPWLRRRAADPQRSHPRDLHRLTGRHLRRLPDPQHEGRFRGLHPDHLHRSGAPQPRLGRQLIAFAEERIFRESPNVFLCVSSFNSDARRLYERLGYELIGELRDYLVRGSSELLMRKTIGPLQA